MYVATTPKKKSRNPRKIDAWDVDFGRRLAKARGKLSQQDMADYLGTPLNTYQKYENGSRSFPKHLIARVVQKTLHGPWLLLTGDPDHLCPAYLVHEPAPTSPVVPMKRRPYPRPVNP